MKDKSNIKMKDSGIPWVGKVPTEWEIKANKYVMHKIKEIKDIYENEDILSLSVDGVKVRDLDAGGKMPTTFDGYQKLYKNNLLMCLFDYDVTPCCIGLIQNDGLTSPAYSQFVMNNNNSEKYYYYYYLLLDFTKELVHLSKNLRHSFTETELGQIKVPVPPIEEQKRIANFLDEKCSKIDKIINDINEQIETLENYKKILISNFATGKSVIIKKKIFKPEKVKDSGAKYIGIIPDGWRVLKVKYLMHRKTVKNMGNEQVLSLYRDYGVIPKDSRDDNYNVTSEDTSKYLYVKKGNFVINKMKAWQGSMAVSEFDGILSPAYYCYEFKSDKINKKYFHYLLRNVLYIPEYRRLSGGIREGQWDLPESEFNNLFIVIPPKDEQDEIVNYLDCKSIVIERIVSDKKQQIESLEKYKKSIIFEYVTGKKQV